MSGTAKRGQGACVLLPALFFLAIFSFFSCSRRLNGPAREMAVRKESVAVRDWTREVRAQKSAALDAYIDSLSERERLAQLFVINLEGDKKFWFVERVEDSDAPQAQKARGQKKSQAQKAAPLIPGGYIFFSFNIARDPAQIAAFCDSVRDFARDHDSAEPFLCLDAEGGYVNRLRGVAGPLPENEWVSKNLPLKDARLLYSLNALQLRALGFDLNLSPVVEVQNERNQKFLDGRSFGGPAQVVQYGSAAVRAYQEIDVGSVLKHFPGNGEADPHLSLPLLEMSEEEFARDVMEPFSALVQAKPSGVLMSHALVNVFKGDASQDQEASQGQKAAAAIPASLSRYWIQDVLRSRLGFEGLVFSDDIFMAALEKNGWRSERAVQAAILAGVNCILMSEKRFENEWALVKKLYHKDAAFKAAADDSIRRVFKFKLDAGILEWDCDSQRVRPAQNRPPVQERLERFYGAKKLNEELLQKYGEE